MPTFSDPERFLLEQWTDARILENCMKELRKRYGTILETVIEKVQKQHPELACRDLRLSNDGVNVGVGKRSWHSKPTYYISGFWLGEIRIDDLTCEYEDAPDKTVWINHPLDGLDIDKARQSLREAAARILSAEELEQADWDWGDDIAGFTIPIPQSRGELLKLLFNDDSRGFIKCMVDHLSSLTPFTSVMDEVYARAKRSRKRS